MGRVFYEKIGDEFVPVSEYDSELLDSFPEGAHLVMVYPGGQSRRYNIEPAEAPLMAAFKTMSEIITRKIVDSSELGPERTPLTKEQAEAWEHFADVMEDGKYFCQYPSAQDITDEVLRFICNEITTRMKNESVRRAYNHFEMLFRLAGEENE